MVILVIVAVIALLVWYICRDSAGERCTQPVKAEILSWEETSGLHDEGPATFSPLIRYYYASKVYECRLNISRTARQIERGYTDASIMILVAPNDPSKCAPM